MIPGSASNSQTYLNTDWTLLRSGVFPLECDQAVWMTTNHGCQRRMYTTLQGLDVSQGWFTPILRFCYSKKKNKKTQNSTFLKTDTLHSFKLLPKVEHYFAEGGQRGKAEGKRGSRDNHKGLI